MRERGTDLVAGFGRVQPQLGLGMDRAAQRHDARQEFAGLVEQRFMQHREFSCQAWIRAAVRRAAALCIVTDTSRSRLSTTA